MSRLTIACLVPVLAFAVASAAPVPPTPPPIYFPTTKGTTFVYRYAIEVNAGPGPAGGMNPTIDEGQVTQVVLAVDQTSAGTIVKLSHKHQGSEFSTTDTFSISPQGVFTTGTSMIGPGIEEERSWKIDPPACLLRLPHKDGTEWEYRSPAQPGGLVGVKATNTAHGPEKVVVPAGTYTAIRVEQTGTSNGKESKATFWYAPEVGLVKMVCEGVVQELKSVIPAK